MPPEECAAVLTAETRGVLSVLGDGGYPYGMPMNHWYEPSDGCIYFHCGAKGHRLDAIRQNPKVSFCCFDKGYRNEGEWACNVRSVIVFGEAEILEDRALTEEISRKLSLKFTSDLAYIEGEIETSLAATRLIRLVPAHISGKYVNEA